MGTKSRTKDPLNEELVHLVRQTIGPRQDIAEKRMFGGVAFLLEGKMTCGVVGNDLMLRISPEDFDAALGEDHIRPMDFTGRPMRGFLYLSRAGWENKKVRKRWVDGGIAYAASLPPKKPRKARPKIPRSKSRTA
jgi:TfoX/Sxy family transcriptional regulator of competence genes